VAKKQVVVVIHGVGVNEAGRSSDQLGAALGHSEFAPHSAHSFQLTEGPAFAVDGKEETFPMPIRRYKNGDQERVLADWSPHERGTNQY